MPQFSPSSSQCSQLSGWEELDSPWPEWIILPTEDSRASTTFSTDVYEQYSPKPDKMDIQYNTNDFDPSSTFPLVSDQTESMLPVEISGVDEFNHVSIRQGQYVQTSTEGVAGTCEFQPGLFAELHPRAAAYNHPQIPVGFLPRNQRVCEAKLGTTSPASESLVRCEAMDTDPYQQDPGDFSTYEQVFGDTALFPMNPDSHVGYRMGASNHHDRFIPNLRFSDVDKRSAPKTSIANKTLRRRDPRLSRVRTTIDYQKAILAAKAAPNRLKKHRKRLYWDTELDCLHHDVYDYVPALSRSAKFDELHNSRAPRLFPTARQHIALAWRSYAFPSQTPPFNIFP